MADTITECPKCGHSQNGGSECEACGIIFSRYETFKQRQQAQQAAYLKKKESRKKSLGMFLTIAAAVVITASATYYFTRPGDNNQPMTQAEFSARQEEGDLPDLHEAVADTALDMPVPETMTVSSRGMLQEARSATVSIQTPWGTGSGFFIAEGNIK